MAKVNKESKTGVLTWVSDDKKSFKVNDGDVYYNYNKQSSDSMTFPKGSEIVVEYTPWSSPDGKVQRNYVNAVTSSNDQMDADIDKAVGDYNAAQEKERALQSKYPMTDTQTSIVRQTCLKAAVELNKAGDRSGDKVSVDDVLVDAALFEDWVNR